MTAFIVHAMPAGDADPCASATHAVVAEGREPCRRCLRNARPGENLLLLPYDPFLVRSPYTGEGPVYVHADGCDEHESAADQLPEQVDGARQFSVRAYDADAMLVDAEIVGADELGRPRPRAARRAARSSCTRTSPARAASRSGSTCAANVNCGIVGERDRPGRGGGCRFSRAMGGPLDNVAPRPLS